MKKIIVLLFISCGLPPLPPLPSIGCDHMEPVCICDRDGECKWMFECVKDEDL